MTHRQLLAQLDEAAELARAAIATGDEETFVAVVKLVGQLLELARLGEHDDPPAHR
jgi:hypothetical protein